MKTENGFKRGAAIVIGSQTDTSKSLIKSFNNNFKASTLLDEENVHIRIAVKRNVRFASPSKNEQRKMSKRRIKKENGKVMPISRGKHR